MVLLSESWSCSRDPSNLSEHMPWYFDKCSCVNSMPGFAWCGSECWASVLVGLHHLITCCRFKMFGIFCTILLLSNSWTKKYCANYFVYWVKIKQVYKTIIAKFLEPNLFFSLKHGIYPIFRMQGGTTKWSKFVSVLLWFIFGKITMNVTKYFEIHMNKVNEWAYFGHVHLTLLIVSYRAFITLIAPPNY
jgi:hypothetical protein